MTRQPVVRCVWLVCMTVLVWSGAARAEDKELAKWTKDVGKRFLAADEPYPCWRGPFGSGAGIDTGTPLVTCVANARKLWMSESLIADAHKFTSLSREHEDLPGPGILDPMPSGGFCSPVVAYRKVYFVYHLPTGDAYFTDACKEWAQDKFRIGRRAWYADADDVLHCFDADTGKTLWKRVYPRSAVNHHAYVWWKNGGHFTSCVADGRVFFYGPTARLYCVDAHTGKPLWQSDLGRRHEMSLGGKAHWLENPNKGASNGSWCMGYAPAYADRVIAMSDGLEFQGGPRNYGYSHLTGFDAETGRPLWKIQGAADDLNSAMRWIYEGREYFVSGGKQGIFCVEPKTGRVLWRIDESCGSTVAVAGPYLVAISGGLKGWKISPRGATHLWTSGEKEPNPRTKQLRMVPPPGFGGYMAPLIYDGRVYSSHTCVDLRTGAILASCEGPPDEGGSKAGVSSPTALNGYLFQEAKGEPQTLYSMFAAPKRFGPTGHSLIAGSNSSVSFAVAYDRIYFRNRRRLLCFDLRKSACGLDLKATRRCIALLHGDDEAVAMQACSALLDVAPAARDTALAALKKASKSRKSGLRSMAGSTLKALASAESAELGIDLETGPEDGGTPGLDGELFGP